MTKEVFGITNQSKQMYANYLGLDSKNKYDSWDVVFSLNDYSMKSILKKTTRSTFAIKCWLKDGQGKDSKPKYWVLFGTSGLIDPFNMSPSARDQRLKTLKFRSVDEATFNNFGKYLHTKNTLHFTKARRTAMESA
jgi:hypothetical protein